MAEVRVTQVGVYSAQSGDEVRVTQVGVYSAQSGDEVRVSQVGVYSVQSGAKLRATAVGAYIATVESKPTTPGIQSPVAGNVYAGTMTISYTASTDPQGGAITYRFRYRAIGDSVWTVAFDGRSGNDQYLEDISGLADGSYEAELQAFATGGTDSESDVATVTGFIIGNGFPDAPIITAPFDGEELTQVVNRVEWVAAVDPDGDPLTYSARYRAIGAGSWTSLFTGVSNLYYDWDQSLFAADDYELEVWANDGANDGPAAYVSFTITIADRPLRPVIRIKAFTDTSVTAELLRYEHPNSTAWKQTEWQVIPYGGDWNNPFDESTVTAVAQQLEESFGGFPPDFRGQIRARFVDVNDNASLWSVGAEFWLPDYAREFVQRWDLNPIWSWSSVGQIQASFRPEISYGVGSTWPGPGYPPAQDDAAIVIKDGPELASFYVSGIVMLDGYNWGIIGRDTELKSQGVGIMDGYKDDGSWQGVVAYLRSGINYSSALGVSTGGAYTADLKVHVKWNDGDTPVENVYVSSVIDCGPVGMMGRLVAGTTNTLGIWIGNWITANNREPWYRIELQVERDHENVETRIRARVKPAGPIDEEPMQFPADSDWHLDITVPRVTPCGIPGFAVAQDGVAHASAVSHYGWLRWKAIRDKGLPIAGNVALPAYTGPVDPGACVPQAETSLPAPVFFPLPPNGEVEEEVTYPTDVIGAWDDTEQRVKLRERPTTVVSYRATLPTSREATSMWAMIYEQQPDRWGVPMWMDAAPLLVTLGSGASSIPAASVDTDTRRFDRMTHIALFVDQFTWDFLPAVLEDDGSITLTGSTSRSYTGGPAGPTWVLPCRVGRMEQRVDAERKAPFIGEIDFTFTLEGVND